MGDDCPHDLSLSPGSGHQWEMWHSWEASESNGSCSGELHEEGVKFVCAWKQEII